MNEFANLAQPLTPAQQRVVALVKRGLSYRQIARELEIAQETARSHVLGIAQKLDNPDRIKPYWCVFLWANGLANSQQNEDSRT